MEKSIINMVEDITKMSEIKIVAVKCIEDDVVYVENGGLGNLITYPKGYDGVIEISFSNNKSENIPLNILEKLLNDSASKANFEKYKTLSLVKNILLEDIDNLKEMEYGFSRLVSYKDVTDYNFNNFEKIEQSSLTSQGLWITNGVRDIELEFDEEFLNFISKTRKKLEGEDKKIVAKAFFNKKDNQTLDEPIEFDVKKKNNSQYVIKLDTDKFLNSFEGTDSSYSFYGYVEVQIRQEALGTRDEMVEYSFSFPFEIKMNDPRLTKTHVKTDQVSIDFGTSSTCIAIDGGKKLLSFNDNPKGMDDYENMTALIIYNWQSIYTSWKRSNSTIPYMLRSKEEADNVSIKSGHFNYGDTIKWELENSPDAKTMDAIITKLKSLPAKFENSPFHKEDIIPFDGWKNKLYLTDKIENENEETLNPIALYGYLIGRSLNLQVKDKIYTRYNLTMPVNFNKYKRERLQESLEYGLRRSLPSVLKDELEVKTSYEESVALLGAAKKLKHLKPSLGKEASLFAVFDFGGGTLDFAFGLYRKSSDNENIAVFENEENKYKNVIEIFKTDGLLSGGETLIESLSWNIYKDNRELMEENKIPIFVPNDEEKIANYPSNLFGDRHIDHVNLQSINETFSREYFIDNKFSKTKVELFSIDGSTHELELSSLNEERVNEFLEEKISSMVENFKNIIESTFKDKLSILEKFGFDDFNIDDVKVLQAGNTCKAKWVKEAFEKFFDSQNNIIFINDEKKEITPKNAVAKGGLMLNGVGIYNHTKVDSDLMPLDRYIWDISLLEEEGEDAEPVFKQGDNSKSEYRNIARISENTFYVYFSQSSQLEDEDDEELEKHNIVIPEHLMEDGKYSIWAKPYDANFIECILSDVKGENMDDSKRMILDLSSGETITGEGIK